MRARTAAQQAVIDAGVQAEFCRVWIKDSGGTFRDLTTYPGFNAVKSVTWAEKIDDPHMTCELVLMREAYRLSLSPFMAGSAINKGFNPAASSSALLALARELLVEIAIVPMDKQPSSGDWFEVFRGRVDDLDAASGSDVTISARGLAGRLAQQFIKTELVYAYAVDGVSKALRIWDTQIPVTTSPLTYLLPASRGDNDPGLNKFLKCSQAGTTGTTEPIWTTGANQTDGSAKWDYVAAPTATGVSVESIMQNILDDNRLSGDPAVALYTPSSPGWAIRQFLQQREFTLDAVRALATQIGWDVRYKWRAGTAQFEFTFYVPTRVSPSVDFTFGPSDYGEPTRLAVNIAEIRNAWRVIYADRSSLWPDGSPKRKVVEVSDSGSIAKYGELWAEIQEDENSNIDTSTEASALANAALSDCKEPTAEFSVPLMRGFPWVELNDFLKFTANALHFDSDQSLAVTAWEQSFVASDDGHAHLATRVDLRGLPTIGAKVHLDKTIHPKKATKQKTAGGAHRLTNFQATKTPTIVFEPTVGGGRLKLELEADKNAQLEEYEIHVSRDPSQPESAATLQALTRARSIELSDLAPGESLFAHVTPRYTNAGRIVRGQPSVEYNFTAGRAYAGHIHEGIAVGDYPLNGGFETRYLTTGVAMPDHWKIVAGGFGTDLDVVEDGFGLSGGRYMRLQPSNGSGDAQVASAQFPVINERVDANRYSQLYRVRAWVKNRADNDGANSLAIHMRGYDYAGGFSTNLDSLIVAADSKLGVWQLVEQYLRVDEADDIRSIDIALVATVTSGNFVVDVDDIRIQWIGSPWYDVGDTANFTDNYEAIPDFENAFENYAFTTHEACSFRRDQRGRVYGKGLAKNATTGTTGTVYTLPVGYRPPRQIRRPTTANGKFAELTIETTGEVTLSAADDADPATIFSVDFSFEVHDNA